MIPFAEKHTKYLNFGQLGVVSQCCFQLSPLHKASLTLASQQPSAYTPCIIMNYGAQFLYWIKGSLAYECLMSSPMY